MSLNLGVKCEDYARMITNHPYSQTAAGYLAKAAGVIKETGSKVVKISIPLFNDGKERVIDAAYAGKENVINAALRANFFFQETIRNYCCKK